LPINPWVFLTAFRVESSLSPLTAELHCRSPPEWSLPCLCFCSLRNNSFL
jgi:hypothetical protein